MDKITETLDNIGIKLFVLAALEEHQFYLSLRFCLFTPCNASVNAVQIVFSDSSNESTAKWEACQIFKDNKQIVGARLASTSVKKRGPFY
jgi:hypothetical protein